jgi:hypothetical protein
MAGKTIISGTYSSGVMLSDPGYGSPLTVTGAINVSTGDAISYLGGTATNWIIANQGVIAASTKGSGIALVNPSTSVTSGSVTNSNGGTIYGGTNGIYINGYGKVTNIGASTISSQSTGVDIRLAGTVSNLSGGVISGTNSEAVFIYGAGKAGEQSKVLVFTRGCCRDRQGSRSFWEAPSPTFQAARSMERTALASTSMGSAASATVG